MGSQKASTRIKKDLDDVARELSTWIKDLNAVLRNPYRIPDRIIARAKFLAKTGKHETTLSWLDSLKKG
jgi:phage-related protein